MENVQSWLIYQACRRHTDKNNYQTQGWSDIPSKNPNAALSKFISELVRMIIYRLVFISKATLTIAFEPFIDERRW